MAAAIRCVFWEDFARLSKDAEMVIYEINKLDAVFRVYAIKENIFIYEEPLPFPEKAEILEDKRRHKVKAHENAFNLTEQNKFTIISRLVDARTLRCGVSYFVTPKLVREADRWTAEFEYRFDSSSVSQFLSRALETPIKCVVEGNLLKIFACVLLCVAPLFGF
jgi:hypothetical protein